METIREEVELNHNGRVIKTTIYTLETVNGKKFDYPGDFDRDNEIDSVDGIIEEVFEEEVNHFFNSGEAKEKIEKTKEKVLSKIKEQLDKMLTIENLKDRYFTGEYSDGLLAYMEWGYEYEGAIVNRFQDLMEDDVIDDVLDNIDV